MWRLDMRETLIFLLNIETPSLTLVWDMSQNFSSKLITWSLEEVMTLSGRNCTTSTEQVNPESSRRWVTAGGAAGNKPKKVVGKNVGCVMDKLQGDYKEPKPQNQRVSDRTDHLKASD
jgi:hypothetical protein